MPAYSQVILNDYAAVTTVNADHVLVNSAAAAAQFSCGDKVLLIQMQGASYSTSGAAGDLASLNNAGHYEYLYVAAVSGQQITFTATLQRSYTPSGAVQLVRVPQYANYTLNTPVTAPPWNGSTGGIVALEVFDTLRLAANIDVTGRGFRGGAIVPPCQTGSYPGCNPPGGGTPILDSDPGGCYGDGDFYELGTLTPDAAGKGEGVAMISNPAHAAGRAKVVNGGGGGGTNEGGGGGGAGFVAGGIGGNCNSVETCGGIYECGCLVEIFGSCVVHQYCFGGCDKSRVAGRGGAGLSAQGFSSVNNRLFMGGGGGAGNSCSTDACYNQTASDGQAGGGLILLQAGTLVSAGGALIADGANGTLMGSTTAMGGGGGGGAGAIVLAIQQYPAAPNSVAVQARGGRGDDADKNNGSFAGPGGGGGGGAVVVRQGSFPAALAVDVSGGAAGRAFNNAGSNAGPRGASAGNDGGLRTGFVLIEAAEPALAGGTIATSNDRYCTTSADPAVLTGATPATSSLTAPNYQWFYRNSSSACSAPSPYALLPVGWTLIPSATGPAYDPPAGLAESRCYIRRTTDCRSARAAWSNVLHIQVDDQTTWTGTFSSDWTDPANWSMGAPSCNCDAVLAPAPNAPSVPIAATATARDVTLQTGANLAVQAGAALAFCGDWQNNGLAQTVAGTGTLVATGSTPQALTGAALTAANFRMANPAGFTLNHDLTVQQTLDLTNGLITTQAHQVRVISSASTAIINASPNSYVHGQLYRAIASGGSYALPVGDASRYQLATVDYSTGAVGDYTALVAEFHNTPVVDALAPVNECGNQSYSSWADNGYWTITGMGGGPNLGQYDLRLYPAGNTVGTTMDYSNTASATVFKRPTGSGPSWSLAGTCDMSSNLNPGDGLVRVGRNAITNGFSDFAIAIDASMPFPIQLTRFSAEQTGAQVQLRWQTAAEQASSHFLLARRTDADTAFALLGRQPAAGYTSRPQAYEALDPAPAPGWNYYRLTQVDLDGQLQRFPPAAVHFQPAAEPQLRFAPNPQPVTEQLRAELYAPAPSSAQITLWDSQGRQLLHQAVATEAGWQTIALPALPLSAGVYLLRVRLPGPTTLSQRLLLRD